MNTQASNTEEQKARVRKIVAKAKAEGREATLNELLPCIGEDVTDRVTVRREGGRTVARLGGRQGSVEWADPETRRRQAAQAAQDRLSTASCERLTALLRAHYPPEETERDIRGAWAKPTPTERFSHMLLIPVVYAAIGRGATMADIEAGLCAPAEGEPLRPEDMTWEQRRMGRNWRLLNRLVPRGCVRRREL